LIFFNQSLKSQRHGWLVVVLVSNEISDLCEISDLLLFFSYFASESKRTKFGNYFFDISCVNKTFWLDAGHSQQATERK